MKTVLLAWELGRGLGHLVTIRLLAGRLKALGLRTVAAIPEAAAAAALHDSCMTVLTAPAWPLALQDSAGQATRSSATLNDILSSAGLADASAARRLLAEWDMLLLKVQPHLVVAEFAPMAALAARGRVPLLVVGTGYTLPPADMPRFPPLHRRSRPVWSEAATLDAVNAAARALNRPRLEHLPELFAGDLSRILTFELLDPYHMQRIDDVDGPLIEGAVRERRDDADLIFVYLSGGYEIPGGLIDALRPFGQRVRIHAPRLNASQRHQLDESGARIDPRPAVLADVLPSCRLVIHQGGHGLVCEALLTGIPQLVLSAQIEQTLNGEALTHAGVGKLLEAYEPTTTVSAALIESMVDDQDMADRTAKAADRHRRRLSGNNPPVKCERACLALLG